MEILFQLSQLLVCDWLLETRTAIWEDTVEAGSKPPVENSVLSAFQADLGSLRSLAEHIPVSISLLPENCNIGCFIKIYVEVIKGIIIK